MGFGGFVKKLGWTAATLASGMPGPIGAVAKAVGAIVGTELNPDKPEEIASAINGATPEQMVELHKFDLQHAEVMQAAGFKTVTDLLQGDNEDRKDARAMQRDIRSWIPAALAITVTVGFFGFLGLLTFHDAPIANAKTLDILTGALTTGWIAVVMFYFGSSAGSQAKDKLLLSVNPTGKGD